MKTYLIEIYRNDGRLLTSSTQRAHIVEDAIMQGLAYFTSVRHGISFDGLTILSKEVTIKEAQA